MSESFNSIEGRLTPELLRRQIDALSEQLSLATGKEKIEIVEKMTELQLQLNESLTTKASQILEEEGRTPEGSSLRDKIGTLYQKAKDNGKLLLVSSGVVFTGAMFEEGHDRFQADDLLSKFEVNRATELLGQADIAHLAMETGLAVAVVSLLLVFLKAATK